MAEFTPIETQEQLNEVIKDRLARERAKYADYEDLKSKVAGYEKQIGEMKTAAEAAGTKITDYERQIAERDATIQSQATAALKTGIALQSGIPYELADRLSGTTEEELRADAANLKKLMGAQSAPPLASTEPANVNPADAAYAAMLANLKGD